MAKTILSYLLWRHLQRAACQAEYTTNQNGIFLAEVLLVGKHIEQNFPLKVFQL